MKKIVYLLIIGLLTGCSDPLEEEVYSAFGPNNFFQKADDAEGLLHSAYPVERRRGFRNYLVMAEVNTDLLIDLINRVRTKGGVSLLKVGNFASKDALRAHLLKERGWEFFSEELCRPDLIRHGKFIEYAKARGKVAFDYQVLYPLPQSEIDWNHHQLPTSPTGLWRGSQCIV